MHIFGIQSTYITSQATKVFMKEVHKLHGFPKVIVSERDPKFINFLKGLWKMSGITLDMSSKFYSQTKGQIKIVNTCLESYLWCYDLDKKTQWMK